ncbi:MAG: undecaprenyl-diphosphate phosphatase [Oscillospiraceae bacterium]|jgi:undecaprenyl-diphosphatase|nr:undecaprenyl-diphosphate phosphatase [Oscillospiraceae bacterium]
MGVLPDILKAVLIGVIEGVTEWLPISSTGHMIIADRFIKLGVSESFLEVFLVVIQLGAALAVAVLYRAALFPFGRGAGSRLAVRRPCLALWGKCLAACVPAAVVGLLFDERLNELFYNDITVASALIVYGAVFIAVEKARASPRKFSSAASLTYRAALGIGAFQILSLIPGTSRSGATILGAMLLGASRGAAAEFSFFLALPVMFGASALKLVKFGFVFSPAEAAVLFSGAASAFVVSLVAVRFLTGYVKKHDFTVFGAYRIVLGLAVLALAYLA